MQVSKGLVAGHQSKHLLNQAAAWVQCPDTLRQRSMVPAQFTIASGVFYVHNEKHRNYTPDAGRWTITEVEERHCFSHALAAGWVGDVEGWGLHFVNGTPAYLGFDRYSSLSFVARFVDAGSTSLWHGFPKAPPDVPSPTALNSWLQHRTLRKKTIRLLSQGRPCDL